MQRIPLDPPKLGLIRMTRASVGGVVRKMTLTFKDGSELRVDIEDESTLLLPDTHSYDDVETLSIPFDQQ